MAIRLGTTAVTLKLGTQAVTGRLGTQIVTASLPGAPTITSATSSTVNYSPPASNGGAAITAYRFYINSVLTTPTSGTLGSSATFGSSLAGASVEVSAVNSVGEGPKSSPFTVAVAPGAPTGLTVTTHLSAQDSADLAWTAPASNGGSAITGYRVYYSFNASDYTLVGTYATTTALLTLASYGGQAVYVRVSAVNAVGEGAYSEVTSGTMSDGLPGVPQGPVMYVSGPLEVTLGWSPPESDGGDAITGYLITYTNPPSEAAYTTTVGPEVTSYTFTAGSTGTQYSATVAATNAIGTGPATSAVTATSADVPGTPSWMSASASSGTTGAIDVSFLAPGSDGGSAITGYQLEYDTASDFATALSQTLSSADPYTLSGLLGGQTYYLRVRAQNAAGSGEWAVWGSNPATASAAAPAVPSGFSVTPDYANNEWDAAWTEESDGGSSITQYEIEESDQDFTSSTTETKSGSGSSYSFAVDVPDVNRKFRIRAVNYIGNGAWSEWITANYDTPTVPGAPTITNATYNTGGNGQTWISYTPPADDGNSGITGYTAYFDGVQATPDTVLSGDLYFNTDYTGQDATLTATNAVGEGAASAAVEVIADN